MLSLLATMILLGPAQSAAPRADEGPMPAAHPISWELRFEYLAPRRIEVQTAGSDHPVVFWYMVYTAINTSNTTRRFHPTFQLVTEDLRVFNTDSGISPIVFDAIRERHKLTHPDLVHPTQAIGDLRRGQGYARQSVAIWRDVDIRGNHFIIYVAGLSGEARIVANPTYQPTEPQAAAADSKDSSALADNPKYFTLRKTLEIRYLLSGSPASRRSADPVRESTRWIMR